PQGQLGLVPMRRPMDDYGGGGGVPVSVGGYPTDAGATDWLGSVARITSAVAPLFYSSGRRALGPESGSGGYGDYPSAAPRALPGPAGARAELRRDRDRKSTRLNSSHKWSSYAFFCLQRRVTLETDAYFLGDELLLTDGYTFFF